MNEPSLAGWPFPPSRVSELETEMLRLPQVDLKTEHVLFGGLYARTIKIPAGTLLTGALMAIDNLCVIDGDITVTTDTGTHRYVGRHVLTAKRGNKRVGHANADTYWTTIVPSKGASTVEEVEEFATPEAALLQSRKTLPPPEEVKEIEL